MLCHLGSGPEFSFRRNCTRWRFWHRWTKFDARNRHSAGRYSNASGQHGNAARWYSNTSGQHGNAARWYGDTSGQHSDTARRHGDAPRRDSASSYNAATVSGCGRGAIYIAVTSGSPFSWRASLGEPAMLATNSFASARVLPPKPMTRRVEERPTPHSIQAVRASSGDRSRLPFEAVRASESHAA